MSLPPLKQHCLGGARGLEKKSLWWLVVLRLGPWQAARVWQEGLSLESHHRVWGREVECCLFCENLAPKQIFFFQDYFNQKEGAGSCFLVARTFFGVCYL